MIKSTSVTAAVAVTDQIQYKEWLSVLKIATILSYWTFGGLLDENAETSTYRI
jgi:hypothetical protein